MIATKPHDIKKIYILFGRCRERRENTVFETYFLTVFQDIVVTEADHPNKYPHNNSNMKCFHLKVFTMETSAARRAKRLTVGVRDIHLDLRGAGQVPASILSHVALQGELRLEKQVHSQSDT